MIVINRRMASFAALILFAVGLAACGESEADQRKVFIEFLQTRIVDKAGVHVPKVTAEETKSFGPYADHYAVITGFTDNPEMMGIGAKMNQVTQRATISTVQELVDHRSDLKSVSEDFAKLREAMNRELAKTNAARAALKQPDDLKPAYDKAFDKDVIAPVRGFNETFPIVEDIAAASLKLADYIDAHRSRVTMAGKSVSGKDPETIKELDVLVKALGANAPRYQDAQRRLRIILQGS